MDPISLALMAFGAIKQGVALYKEVKGTVGDVNHIVDDISKNLGGFFTHQEKAIEEFEAKKKNPPKGVSLQTIALENVLAQKRLEQAEVELREMLVYQAPPELGAIWEPFQKERARLKKEKEDKEAAEKKGFGQKPVKAKSSGINGSLDLLLLPLSLLSPLKLQV